MACPLPFSSLLSVIQPGRATDSPSCAPCRQIRLLSLHQVLFPGPVEMLLDLSALRESSLMVTGQLACPPAALGFMTIVGWDPCSLCLSATWSPCLVREEVRPVSSPLGLWHPVGMNAVGSVNRQQPPQGPGFASPLTVVAFCLPSGLGRGAGPLRPVLQPGPVLLCWLADLCAGGHLRRVCGKECCPGQGSCGWEPL